MTTATRHDLRETPREARHAIPGPSLADPASDPSATGQGAGRTPRRASPHDFIWPEHDLLTAEQECALARRRDEGDVSARNELVCRSLRLGAKMARDYVRAHRRFCLSAAEAAACEGLIRAADKFDPSLGFRFTSYAGRWIASYLQRARHEAAYPVSLPVHALAWEADVLAGRPARYRPAEGTLEAIRRTRTAAVLGSASADGTPGPVASLPAAEDDHAEALDRREEAERVRRAVDRLPPRVAGVVRLRHGLGGGVGLNYAEIGAALGVSHQRARQIEQRGMALLRRDLAPTPSKGGRP